GDALGLSAFLKNVRMVPELIGKFFLPVHFQLVPLFSWPDTITGVVAAALIIGLIMRAGLGGNRRIQLGLVWFLLCILPVMMFRNGDAQYIFDYLYHRAYLPSVGLMLVLGEILARARREINLRHLLYCALPVLAYCAVTSFRESGYYREPSVFFTEAIART